MPGNNPILPLLPIKSDALPKPPPRRPQQPPQRRPSSRFPRVSLGAHHLAPRPKKAPGVAHCGSQGLVGING